jgi:amino acid transporter
MSETPLPSEHPPVQSGALKRQLGWFGVLLLTLSCLSPVFSIYGVGAQVLKQAGTGATPLFAIALIAALVWAALYAELGSAFPYAGGDYVGVGRVLGPVAGFINLVLWVATAGPSTALQAKVVADYVQEIVPHLDANLITFGSLGLATIVALFAVRTSAWITGVFLAIEMAAVLILFTAGVIHPIREPITLSAHPLAAGPHGILVPVAIGALTTALVSAVYGTLGGNQALFFGEELKEPHRYMGRVVLIAALIGGLATALPVITVLVGAKDLGAILASHAPFSQIVSENLGPAWGVAVSVGVALAIFNAIIAQLMALSRLVFSMGRDGVFPAVISRGLTTVSKTGAPIGATLVFAAISAACCFVKEEPLLTFCAGFVVYCLPMVSAAVWVGRNKGLTGGTGFWRAPLSPLAPLLGLLMAAGFLVADLLDADSGRPSILILGGLCAAGAAWYWFVLRPKGWTPKIEGEISGAAGEATP